MIEPWIAIMVLVVGSILACAVSHFHGLYQQRQQCRDSSVLGLREGMPEMKLYQEGDKSRAICGHCETVVATTFMCRDVPFSDGKGIAKAILVGVCDTCSQVVSIPAQSTPAIQQLLSPGGHFEQQIQTNDLGRV
ncbi:hypothetical protein [Pseudomonas sp. PLMAX]|uniref:hypothetical protein n=1 Tax=Pseudomonas sp. PLMAX TaxID=2201998 RepID=UPI0038B74494